MVIHKKVRQILHMALGVVTNPQFLHYKSMNWIKGNLNKVLVSLVSISTKSQDTSLHPLVQILEDKIEAVKRGNTLAKTMAVLKILEPLMERLKDPKDKYIAGTK